MDSLSGRGLQTCRSELRLWYGTRIRRRSIRCSSAESAMKEGIKCKAGQAATNLLRYAICILPKVIQTHMGTARATLEKI